MYLVGVNMKDLITHIASDVAGLGVLAAGGATSAGAAVPAKNRKKKKI